MFLAAKLQKLFIKTRGRGFAWLFALPWLALNGCALLGGGNIPVQHADGYSVSAPTHWQAVQNNESGSDHAYRTASGNLVEMNSSCHHLQGRNLQILTRELLIGERDVQIVDQHKMEIGGFPALYSVLTSTLEGVSFNLRAVVVEAHDCVFDFTLVGIKPISERESSEFFSYVRTFKYGKN